MDKAYSTRCWIGIEQEHNYNYGDLTLFVESTNVDFKLIYDIWKKHKECKHIYLGAGEVDIKCCSNIEYANQILVDFILEVDARNFNLIPSAIKNICSSIVIRNSFNDDLVGKIPIFMKYRTLDNVYMSLLDLNSRNSLENLSNMMYQDDIIVYEEEIK